jgi:hypothetical protein
MKRVFTFVAMMFGLALLLAPLGVRASGGGGGSSTDTIKVSKCYYDAPTGEGLIKASSSDTGAQLTAYLPTGEVYGLVQNGGGGRYGGTVMRYQPTDPVYVTIRSSSGGSITVPTTPFQP